MFGRKKQSKEEQAYQREREWREGVERDAREAVVAAGQGAAHGARGCG